MFKKSLATAALAVFAVFAFAPAANAANYVSDTVNVSVTAAPVAGGVAEIAFKNGAFAAGESVTYTATGSQAVTLSVIKTAVTSSLTKNANADGSSSLKVAVPTNATGTFSITAKSATKSYTASLDVVAADAGVANPTANAANGLAATGYNVPVLAIWGAAGLLALGVALVLVRIAVRRQHASA